MNKEIRSHFKIFNQVQDQGGLRGTTTIIVKNPDQRSGLLLRKKPARVGGHAPQTPVAIHPRAKHGAFWLFHVSYFEDWTPRSNAEIGPEGRF